MLCGILIRMHHALLHGMISRLRVNLNYIAFTNQRQIHVKVFIWDRVSLLDFGRKKKVERVICGIDGTYRWDTV